MDIISTQPSFNAFYSNPDLPTNPLDLKILNLLISHALKYPKTFFGLSSTNLLRAVHGQGMRGSSRRFTQGEIGEVRRALLILERDGLVYSIKRSKPRWFPATKAIAAHGFSKGSQTSLETWVV